MTDLRKQLGGIENIRIFDDGTVPGGETQIGPKKFKW